MAKAAAIAFLKNAFCIVGRSPDIRTKSDISEKKNADAIMHMIPLVCLLSFTMNKSNQFAGAFL